MWTEEKLKEAADEFWRKCFEKYHKEYKSTTLKEAFLAGCKYIINNTQKDNENKVRKEDMEAED